MFHRLFYNSSFSHVIRSSYLLHNKNRHIVYTVGNRFYCKNEECKTDTTKKVYDDCKSSPRNISEACKISQAKPCFPCPPSRTRIGPQKCMPGSNMDKISQPDCPWEEDDKKNNKTIIIGLLVAAVSIAAFWYAVTTSSSGKKKSAKKRSPFARPKPTCKVPINAKTIPKDVPYLLIGGGTASFSAFRAIKSADPTAKVLVVSNECFYPYMRPPLSKEVWYHLSDSNVKKLNFKQWNGTERSLFYEPNDFYIEPSQLLKNPNGGVAIIQGYSVKKIDVVGKKAFLDDGTEIAYGKCLIATGATPKNLEVFEKAAPVIQNRITLFRDIFDYQELSEICKEATAIAIVGGGFLGSELACALGKLGNEKGIKIYQIFKEKGNMGKVLPEYLSEWTTNKVKQERVNVITQSEVENVSYSKKDKKVVLHLNNGSNILVDHVICSIGVKPNTSLAKTSDLEVDAEYGGFLVNAEMEARSNLYAAGDCSCFYDVKLGRRRVEHHDHAVVTGRLAGENMTGAAKPYVHQSMFWSDLGPKIGYEAIGHVDSSLPTVAVFAKATAKDNPQAAVEASDNNLRSEADKPKEQRTVELDTAAEVSPPGDEYGKGVIFYLRNDIVVGIVLWNVFNRMSTARQVLKDEKKYDDLNEVAKLFNIHED